MKSLFRIASFLALCFAVTILVVAGGVAIASFVRWMATGENIAASSIVMLTNMPEAIMVMWLMLIVLIVETNRP